ncbi:MAG: hypothetical protein KDK99_06895 [Verrucomicrobiales bacterium]|nr:hypothetical protein [Verrucomicrobiales bacterium]
MGAASKFFRSISPSVALAVGTITFATVSLLPNGLRWPTRALFFLSLIVLLGHLVRGLHRSKTNPRAWLFTGIALALGLAVAYGVGEVGAAVLLKLRPDLGTAPLELTEPQRASLTRSLEDTTSYIQYDPELGWSVRPNARSEDGLAQSNALGCRADREYATEVPEGSFRILTFGDSYTHCNEVANPDTWQVAAESARPDLEVVNGGVGGYGVTQSLLRCRSGMQHLKTHVVILGCMTDDLRRSLNAYYPFRFDNPRQAPSASGLPFSTLDRDGKLQIHPNPLGSQERMRQLLDDPTTLLPELAQLEPLYTPARATPLTDLLAHQWPVMEEKLSPLTAALKTRWDILCNRRSSPSRRAPRAPSIYEPGHPVFEVNAQLFQTFAQEVREAGLHPVVLWFPNPKDLAKMVENRDTPIYSRYLTRLQEAGIEVHDVLDWIREDAAPHTPADVAALYSGGHFSPAANRIIGHRIARMPWIPPHEAGFKQTPTPE